MEPARPAILWEKDEARPGAVRCRLCCHRCRIPEGRTGFCGVRENRAGALHTLVYGLLVAQSIDPIEKKPLFHVRPGSLSYSIATAGCNFRCSHCQNYHISQVQRDEGRIPGRYVSPEEVVREATASGSRSISYTYTEPTIFLEYALDCMKLARRAGLLNVFVTNGYLTPEAIDVAAPYLDAANVDLKAMTEDFYREICGARLEPVLASIRELRSRGVWVEVTTLVIPHQNDRPDELRAVARFLASVSAETPWHVSGFYPTYRLTREPPTPAALLEETRRIGLGEGLRHVYVGNRPGGGGEDTTCPACRATVIARRGFSIVGTSLTPEGACSRCGTEIAGIGLA